jgi:quinol monooxygenase YgiN
MREELAVLAARSRADEGCLRYDVLEEVDSPDGFLLCEEWLDEASLVAHNSRPHVARFVEVSPPLLREPMRVQRLRRAR